MTWKRSVTAKSPVHVAVGDQVGDSAVRTKEIRLLVIAQSLPAHLFGAGIIGTVVNLMIDLG